MMLAAPLKPCPCGCAEPPIRENCEEEEDCDEFGPWVVCGSNQCSFSAREPAWNRRAPSPDALAALDAVIGEMEAWHLWSGGKGAQPRPLHWGNLAHALREVRRLMGGE